MEYRVLGKTGLKVSRIGFGGIPIQRIDAEGTKKLIHYLHDAGVNYIDTARSYTVSEEYLGYALEGIRQDFILATKSPASTKEGMAEDIETSQANIDKLDKLFKSAVKAEVEKRLAGNAPKGNTSTTTEITKDSAKKMSMAELNALAQSNPELFNKIFN